MLVGSIGRITVAGGNGKKVKDGVHAHERAMHKGKPLTKMPASVTKDSSNRSSKRTNK